MAFHTFGSPVVGYVRSVRLHDPELDVAEQLIREHARAYGLNLVHVFREEGISSVASWRPELEKLIHGLKHHDWAGVLIPDDTHWSRNKNMAARIRGRVERIGWVTVLNDHG